MNKAESVRKKRKEGFFGVHFDFHAQKESENIGKYTTKEMLADFLDRVQPDFVQCDCKGHPGYCSYATQLGNQAPGLTGDALHIWREVTAERGIPLIMHYSGVADERAVQERPEWHVELQDGSIDPRSTDVFSDYADRLLIPQAKELYEKYGVDGMWIDGDSWAVVENYAPEAIARFRKETGNQEELPSLAFKEYYREGFRRYLKHYVDEIHEACPGFELTSNSAFTSYMPGEVCADVDFLSCDSPSYQGVNIIRRKARSMALQGKPWDVMPWAFLVQAGHEYHAMKTVSQLCQEAGIILSLGGSFQCYLPQKKDGSIRAQHADIIAKVGEFCRQRQEICHQASSIAQVAVLLSVEAYYRVCKLPFAPWNGELTELDGVLEALLDRQYAVDLVMDHQLQDMKRYQVIVVPGWEEMGSSMQERLRSFVEKGGSCIITGLKAAKAFEKELQVRIKSRKGTRKRWIEGNDSLYGVEAPEAEVELCGAQEYARFYMDFDQDRLGETAATVVGYGKGSFAGVYFDFGTYYKRNWSSTAGEFLEGLMKRLQPEPRFEVHGSHMVDVVLSEKDGGLIVNLVNMTGLRGNLGAYIYDEIPALGPITVSYRTAEPPRSVKVFPGGEELPVRYENGLASVTLPKLEIHAALKFCR